MLNIKFGMRNLELESSIQRCVINDYDWDDKERPYILLNDAFGLVFNIEDYLGVYDASCDTRIIPNSNTKKSIISGINQTLLTLLHNNLD